MKKNFWKIAGYAVLGLTLLSIAALAVAVCRLNMLPGKYLWPLLLVLVLVAGVMTLVLLPRRTGKFGTPARTQKGLRIAAWVLALLVSVGCVTGTAALTKLQQTMGEVMNRTVISDVIGVYVLADDPAQTIDDASTYTFAVTESFDWDNTLKTLQGIQDATGVTIQIRKYDSVFAMIDALYSGQVRAIVLNTAYASILEEVEDYGTFHSKTLKVFDFGIEETIPVTEPPTVPETQPGDSAAPTQDPENPPFIIYLSGSDTRSKVLSTSRSDVNILAVVNPETRQILLVNTPRDYYVPNPAGNGALDKLTHCGIYGVDCSMQALGDLYGVTVDHHAQVNFTGFETLVDAIGGVTVYSDVSFTIGKYQFSKGENSLNGEKALVFARERYSLAGGDNARGRNQMKIIAAIVQKMASSTILTRYTEILDSMSGTFVTSVPQEMLEKLVKQQLENMGPWDIKSYAVTGYGDSKITYSMPGFYAYVMQPNQTTVDHAASLMQRVLAGETLTDDDLTTPES